LALERPIRMNERRCEYKQSYRHRTQFQNDLHWDLHFSELPREPCRCADEGWATRQVPEASRSVRGFGGWDYRPLRVTPDMKAATLNHVTLKVDNVQRSSKFYQDVFGMPLNQHSDETHILGVGKSFLGIEQKPNAPAMDHFDLGIANFKADEVVAKLKARNLSWRRVGRRNLSNFGIPMASWFS